MIHVEDFKLRLTDRLHELDTRLHVVEEQLDEAMSADSEERATEREGDEVLEELGHAGELEIKAIQAALARIEAGTFGICAKCGAEISPERLVAVPHAALCRDCA